MLNYLLRRHVSTYTVTIQKFCNCAPPKRLLYIPEKCTNQLQRCISARTLTAKSFRYEFKNEGQKTESRIYLVHKIKAIKKL